MSFPISPCSSARDTKFFGNTKPSSGCCQRAKTSKTSQSASSKVHQRLEAWHEFFILEGATYFSDIDSHARTLC